ncbi:MAG: porin [Thiobacillus sp.]|nr:porin [Thiobacillus sp.]
MKKSLIALAVAGVVSAPAFAATANVDVYGKMHVSVSLYDDQPNTTNDVQVSSNASRIGFKGAEDLGGGLSAIWQLESTVDLDEQGGSFATRNSFVGLKGGFGTVIAGTNDTPLKNVGRKIDLFGDTIADSRNVMGQGSDTRAKNMVAYMSPSFSGLDFAAAYSTDLGAASTAGDADNSSVYNLSATYANGPLFLGLGYGDGDGHEKAGFGKHMRAAAGYTFGAFKLVGQYDKRDDDNTLNAGAQNGDFNAWLVGGSFTMGAMVFKANYMDGDFDGVGAADPKQWTVGMDYNLSKRTTVYALYADAENFSLGRGVGSTDQVGGTGVAPATGDVSAFSLGITHTF